jgi:hypothetical protein
LLQEYVLSVFGTLGILCLFSVLLSYNLLLHFGISFSSGMPFGVVVHSFTEPPFIIYFHSHVALGQIKKARMNFQNLNRQWCLQVMQTKIHSRYVWAKAL